MTMRSGGNLELILIQGTLKLSAIAFGIGLLFSLVLLVLMRVFHVQGETIVDAILGLFY